MTQSRFPDLQSRFSDNAQGGRGQFGQRAGTQGARPISGTILNQDEESITVELQDGGSKIVFLTDESTINKTEEGSEDDLSDGEQVVIFGQENSDGSIMAQNIQIGMGGFRRRE